MFHKKNADYYERNNMGNDLGNWIKIFAFPIGCKFVRPVLPLVGFVHILPTAKPSVTSKSDKLMAFSCRENENQILLFWYALMRTAFQINLCPVSDLWLTGLVTANPKFNSVLSIYNVDSTQPCLQPTSCPLLQLDQILQPQCHGNDFESRISNDLIASIVR